jgi:hypothetical protein
MVFARDEKGKVRQTVNAAFDVTERMRAEEALRCVHDELSLNGPANSRPSTKR